MPEAKAKLIAGEQFTISQPYAEGHVLTAAEARSLNQTRSENIGNNLRKAIEEAKKAGKSADEMAKLVSEYDTAYSFAMPGAGGTPRIVDPIEREARKLAREVVGARLKELYQIGLSGIHPDYKDMPEEEGKAKSKERFDAAIDNAAANADVIKQAKKNVAARKATAESAASELGL